MRRLRLLLCLALPAWGQITVTASKQADVIPEAYVGTRMPAGISVYLVATCNSGPAENSVFLDRIAAEVSAVAPVQDGAAVLYAARTHKSGTWKVAAYRIGGVAAMAAGGFASAGATTVLGQIAGGVGGAAGVSTLLKARGEELSRLDVPSNWWTPDPTKAAILNPGQCHHMLLALGGKPPETFTREIPTIKDSLQVQPAGKIVPTHTEPTAGAKLAAMRQRDIEFWTGVSQ